jgi:hypothetical protein
VIRHGNLYRIYLGLIHLLRVGLHLNYRLPNVNRDGHISSSRRQYRSELFSSKTSSVGVRGREPGGCVKAGGGMQEESIFRRTSIHRCLLKNLYPIEDKCLYCPDLPVVRFRREWIRDDVQHVRVLRCMSSSQISSFTSQPYERRRRRACNYEKLS